MGKEKQFKPLKILFSNKTTLILLVIFAVAMAYGTFLENDFGTPAARILIYEAWWFELAMILLALNFMGNVFRYRLFVREKWGLLLFHVAFIVIIIGAGITRTTGVEGLIRIREGQQSNVLISQKHYLQVRIEDEQGQRYLEKPLAVSSVTPPKFDISIDGDTPLRIVASTFTPDAEEVLLPGDEEDLVIRLATANADGRIDHLLERGQEVRRDGLIISLDRPSQSAINILNRTDGLWMSSSVALESLTMATQQAGAVPADSLVPLLPRTLYQSSMGAFVVSDIQPRKKVGYRTTEDKEAAKVLPDRLEVVLSSDGKQETIALEAREGLIGKDKIIDWEGTQIGLNYGPKPILLPFSIHLNDFQLERYPGSTSPSSYASEVTVVDGDTEMTYRIYMNHVLDYRGYRFFQASYDLDEMGTVLSVNKDWWGTQVTYFGYLLMGLGMLWTLFGRSSRFAELNRKLKGLRATNTTRAAATLVALLLLPLFSKANDRSETGMKAEREAMELTNLVSRQHIDPSHAAAFGQLLVQDLDGRIKPINTLGSEFLRKVARKLTFRLEAAPNLPPMTSDQVFLSLHVDPAAWQRVPLIRVDVKKGASIFHLLKVEPKKYLAFQDFIDDQGNYQLQRWVEMANRKKPAGRNTLDQEVIKVDERFNIVFQALSGQYLKIFPQPHHPDKTWFTTQFQNAGFSREDSLFVKGIIPSYLRSVQEARIDGEWAQAADQLAYIRTFQQVLGADVSPSRYQVLAELRYNQWNLFTRLFPFFWLLGIGLLGVAITHVFKGEVQWVEWATRIGTWFAVLGFIVLTANMILRWYAGGHPPWSNGYEMTLLVTWALFFFSLLFVRKSRFILPLACLFGGTLLFVAFLDWLNPEITNLVPVLKSYWLKIHVAIIVSSYAPLALSALLGFMVLWMMIMKGKHPNAGIERSIREMTYLNEMSMTIGLFLLAIGTFLGGIWANESWGRYWGWDPKETWALISIILYAAVLHMRLVPGLRGHYAFNLASVVAFSSIVMTSFGVNYYLAGLHSYAKGDPVPIPTFVYWTCVIVLFTASAAYWQNNKQAAANPTVGS